jgi:carboxypeptidase family protein
MLKSVVVDGRDVIDTPVEVRSGGKLTGVSLVFTDMLSEVTGTVTDDRGPPFTEYTVLAFSADPALWRAQTRHIMTARPDQNGRYQLRGLPPGEYFLTTVDPAEQGEWFEPSFLEAHRAGASALSLGEGDIKTHDFKLPR